MSSALIAKTLPALSAKSGRGVPHGAVRQVAACESSVSQCRVEKGRGTSRKDNRTRGKKKITKGFAGGLFTAASL